MDLKKPHWTMWFGLFSQQLDSNSLLSILLHVKGHHGPSSYQVRLKKPNQSNQNQRLALPLALLGFPFCSKQNRKPSVPEDLVLQGLTYETIISCQPDSIKLSKRVLLRAFLYSSKHPKEVGRFCNRQTFFLLSVKTVDTFHTWVHYWQSF